MTWAEGLRPNSVGSHMLHLSRKLKHFDDWALYALATSTREGATTRSLAARLYVAEKELAIARALPRS
jgi:hypothetical protein